MALKRLHSFRDCIVRQLRASFFIQKSMQLPFAESRVFETQALLTLPSLSRRGHHLGALLSKCGGTSSRNFSIKTLARFSRPVMHLACVPPKLFTFHFSSSLPSFRNVNAEAGGVEPSHQLSSISRFSGPYSTPTACLHKCKIGRIRTCVELVLSPSRASY